MASTPSKLTNHAYRTAWIASTWVCLLLAGCRSNEQKTHSDPVVRSSGSRAHPTVVSTGSSKSPRPPSTPERSSRAPASSAPYPVALKANEFALGTPAPVVLGKDVMVAKNKQDELIVSRLTDGQFEPITIPFDQVSPWPVALASGSATHAYWISRGRLIRRQIKADGVGSVEVIVSDAANGTLVAAARSTGAAERDVVLYVGKGESADGERSANVWVEGQGSRPMSREAGGVTSLSLVALGAGRFALITLDGRVGMSPVHAVFLELDAEGVPHLGEDRVVHVAGSAEIGSALTGVQLGRGPLVLLPISKDERNFGLLMLRVGHGAEAPSTWVDYPNGMDPAPSAAALVCGRPTIAFVHPSTAAPQSNRVLELAYVSSTGELQGRHPVASSAKMPHIDLWGDASGGWLAYATEQGLRGQPIACN